MSIPISMMVNGKKVSKSCPANRTLGQFIREDLGLTGTHIGCDTSQCGACTVHLNGDAVKACTVLAVQAEGAEITTIEGIGTKDNLHPMQTAFRACHGLQCGFCTPGMIMTGIDLVKTSRVGNAELDESTIREGLKGNYCRCTGYHNIVRAVATAAKEMED